MWYILYTFSWQCRVDLSHRLWDTGRVSSHRHNLSFTTKLKPLRILESKEWKFWKLLRLVHSYVLLFLSVSSTKHHNLSWLSLLFLARILYNFISACPKPVSLHAPTSVLPPLRIPSLHPAKSTSPSSRLLCHFISTFLIWMLHFTV